LVRCKQIHDLWDKKNIVLQLTPIT
jgi:hypothetical protein